MIRLVVHGARGRMGARVCALAERDERFTVVARLDREEAEQIDVPACDVVIDFSTPDGAALAAQRAQRHRAALLVGTTGLSGEIVRRLGDAARSIPIVVAPNTSLGVAVLAHLAAEAARLLGPAFDIDVVEAHHSGKRDAPSGTALRLVAAMAERGGRTVAPERVHAIRAGEIVGEHTIRFSGPGECLALSHSAVSRDLFAAGALRIAAWLRGRPPGTYTVEQTLAP
jgi:4-hydroxy-tetrahydrodipicolinate reductase